MTSKRNLDNVLPACEHAANTSDQTASDNSRAEKGGVKKSRFTDEMYDALLPKIIHPPVAVTQAAVAKELKNMAEIRIVGATSRTKVGIGNIEDGTAVDAGIWETRTCLVLTPLFPSGQPAETTRYNWLGENHDDWLSYTTHGKRHIWRAQPSDGGEAHELEVRIGTKMDRILGCIHARSCRQDVIRHGDFQDCCGWKESEYFTKEKGRFKTERCIMRNHLSTISRELGIIVRPEPGGFRFSQPTR